MKFWLANEVSQKNFQTKLRSAAAFAGKILMPAEQGSEAR